ncbi:vomeronasal type-2 receptor 26-like [Sminthopsis crassicaudata]|uniref:vomeronasal type-2 receptor 26-like n=1 Tax=Sminthopsis crassicaudata TaxID=9301 RepID=UPI003D688BC9
MVEFMKLHLMPSGQISIRWWLPKHYYQVLALMFAVEEINRNPHLLPNITLGFHIYNAYPNDERALESSLMWLSGQGETIPNYSCEKEGKSAGVIGGATSEMTFSMGTLLELYKFPQISYGLFDPLLSDSLQFPSVYQMAPRDTSLPLAMVRLMLHFKWTWIGLVASDDSRGEKFLRDLQEEMARNDVCVAFVHKIFTRQSFGNNLHEILTTTIIASTAKVVVIYGDTDSVLGWTHSQIQFKLIWRMWITSSHWDIAKKPSYIYFNYFHGALIFSDQTSKIPGFKHFLKTIHPAKYPEDIFLKNFWNTAFGCTYEHGEGDEGICSPNASLDTLRLSYLDITMSDQSYTVYTAVYALAWALHEMFLVKSEMESDIEGDNRLVYPWKLHSFLKNIRFNNSAGNLVVLDKKRNSVAHYDILNYVTFDNDTEVLVKVGEFISQAPLGQDLTIQEKAIEWPTWNGKVKKLIKTWLYERCKYKNIGHQSSHLAFKKLLQMLQNLIGRLSLQIKFLCPIQFTWGKDKSSITYAPLEEESNVYCKISP